VRIAVEAWAPEFGAEVDLGSPQEFTVEQVDVTCETKEWAPRRPAPLGRLGELPVAFVDGTRRNEARIAVSKNGEMPAPGIAASIGVGATVCDPGPPGVDGRRNGRWWTARSARLRSERVDRFLAVGGGLDVQLSAGAGLEYRSLPVPGYEIEKIDKALHNSMRSREAQMAQELASQEMLVFVDGPLALMSPDPLPMLGYIKSHHRRYLDDDEQLVVGRLGCGERTPLFAFGEQRRRLSWYLRLCEPDDDLGGWHGVVRCETPAELPLDQAVSLADASVSILPAFAAAPHWDPRAPQNLVPIAGLEKRLKHLLGERDLVYRMVRSAAHRAGRETPVTAGGD
jgi:uncharacterized protein